MPKIILRKLEFYITNVCNMTCSGCNRFNNYNFTGWQSWEEYGPVLTEWAKYIDIKQIVILGGEPLLNPDILKWITGLNQLWGSGVQVLSNGTRIDKVKGLYNTCLKENSWIGISLHSDSDRQEIVQKIRNFLKAPIIETEYSNSSVYNNGSVYKFTDVNHKSVGVHTDSMFHQSSILEQPLGKFSLHNSDPDIAYAANCGGREIKNHHMIRGKIYKCAPVALLPEFDQQHQFEISDQDRIILNSYQPLAVEEFHARGKEFFQTIDTAGPQCKFCPESLNYRPITFGIKKSKSTAD